LAYGDLGTVETVITAERERDNDHDDEHEASPDYTMRRLASQEYEGPGSRALKGRHELVLHVGDIVYSDYGCHIFMPFTM